MPEIMPIMLELCLMLLVTYYAKNYAGIIDSSLIISLLFLLSSATTRELLTLKVLGLLHRQLYYYYQSISVVRFCLLSLEATPHIPHKGHECVQWEAIECLPVIINLVYSSLVCYP